MKICFITPLFEPWNIGGAEKYINLLVNSCSKNQDVIVITTKGPNPRESKKENQNLKIYELKNANISSYYSILKTQSILNPVKVFFWSIFDLWNLSNYFQILKILKSEKPDIVHINGITGLSPSVFSAVKKLKIPHVITLHNYEIISKWATLFRNGKPIKKFNIFEKIFIKFMKKITLSVSAVIAPSHFCMNYHTNLGYFMKSEKHIIPHGTLQQNNVIHKEGVGHEFLFVGRLIQQKGPQNAIKSFKMVNQKDLKLHIVGEGPYLKTLKKLAEKDPRIIFHGHQTGSNLESIMKQCSYGIVPSLSYETYGFIIHELMSLGIPIIGSNRGAIPELIKHEFNGFIYDPDDYTSLAKLIKYLINDSNILSTLSTNAIKTVNDYTIEKQLDMTMKVFSSLK